MLNLVPLHINKLTPIQEVELDDYPDVDSCASANELDNVVYRDTIVRIEFNGTAVYEWNFYEYLTAEDGNSMADAGHVELTDLRD